MFEQRNNKEFNDNNLYSYKERLNLNVNEKEEIVQKALNFIHDGGTYFFDVSTNVQLLAKKLSEKATIFTHSIDNYNILYEKEEVSVNLIAGEFNDKNRFFYRNDYKKYFDGIQFDSAFIGACAIRSDGIYYENEEDALIKREVAKISKKVILLAEHQKYEKVNRYKGLDLDQINVIIVDPISVSTFSEIMNLQNIRLNPKSLIIM